MSLTILYGIKENRRDVTDICLTQLNKNNIITIPAGDIVRGSYFGDHLVGTVKKVFIILNGNETEHIQNYSITINLGDYTLSTPINPEAIHEKLNNIHSNLKIRHGSLRDEFPEQRMAVSYLTGNEKVLEIGGNIGRNSLVIASIVNNNNFVSLETDSKIAKQLEENRDLNNFTFHIENSALSKRKLIQRGWDTKPSDVLESGYFWVNTLTIDQLKEKYNIPFDTLVLDCEGAFYYILMDMPEILNGINTIIMENDYHDIRHKSFVDSTLKQNNFYNCYREAGGWGCCYSNFFEVWKRQGV